MEAGGTAALIILALEGAEHELLLFTAFWFLVGACDDIAVDLVWVWLSLSGRATDGRLQAGAASAALNGPSAILVAAWQEEAVIGSMLRHLLGAWQQRDFVVFLGCYANDPGTVRAAMAAAEGDARVRLVVHAAAGPTTKADCLNRIYRALCDEERRRGIIFRSVVLHDSEDMVHPAALAVIDAALDEAEFVQLPVRPEPQPASPWVGGHYSDEFTEAHAKALVVRGALGAALPAAGVGCGFARVLLDRVARRRAGQGEEGPFAARCLTEDYEFGVLVAREGLRSRFVRMRDESGALVATRAYFPSRFADSVRQKTRWIHGIAFQSWDRLGWGRGTVDRWMTLRDRRGPFSALVLAFAYGLVLVEGLLALAALSGWERRGDIPPILFVSSAVCAFAFAWRALWRFGFTAQEYGLREGALAVARLPVANVIAIVAGARATIAYARVLGGETITWDKTRHDRHPAQRRVSAEQQP